MTIVIIEDEKLTANDLKRTILSIDSDIEVLTLLHSVEEGIEYFKQDRIVDLIFADIQLGDGLSFEIFKTMDAQPPIIFCTAFNNYFAEAFQTAGIDYILKPFSTETIEKALSKYIHLEKQFNKNTCNIKSQLAHLEQKIVSKKNAIIVRQRDKIIPIEAASIALFYIENGYTYAFTFNEDKHLISENLEQLEQWFAPQFFRANRQFLVNRLAIKDAQHFFNRKIILNLNVTFNEKILIGKLKITAFTEWLTGGTG